MSNRKKYGALSSFVKKYVTTAEAARRMGVSPYVLKCALDKDRIEFVKVKDRRYINRKDITEFLEKGYVIGQAPHYRVGPPVPNYPEDPEEREFVEGTIKEAKEVYQWLHDKEPPVGWEGNDWVKAEEPKAEEPKAEEAQNKRGHFSFDLAKGVVNETESSESDVDPRPREVSGYEVVLDKMDELVSKYNLSEAIGAEDAAIKFSLAWHELYRTAVHNVHRNDK